MFRTEKSEKSLDLRMFQKLHIKEENHNTSNWILPTFNHQRLQASRLQSSDVHHCGTSARSFPTFFKEQCPQQASVLSEFLQSGQSHSS